MPKLLKNYFDYFLIYLVIAFSVVPFFSSNKMLLVFVTVILIITSVIKSNANITISKSYLQILLLLALMYLGQIYTLNLDKIDLKSIFGTYIRFSFPFFAMTTVGQSFIKKFIKLNYSLGIIVIVIWLLENIIPQLGSVIQEISKSLALDTESNENILIYNTEQKLSPFGLLKSSGFAYEGGAYSIILIIALMFNFIETRTFKNKETFIFIANILATFSTAGYVTLSILVITSMLLFNSRNTVKLILIFVMLILISSYTILNFSFLGEKIISQIQIAKDDQYSTRGRFASAQADLIEWTRNPIFGVGKFDETRFGVFTDEVEQHRVNGVADFLAKFGAIFFIGFYYIMYKSFKKYCKFNKIKSNFLIFLFFIVIILLSFAQIANQWPVYTLFLYLTIYKTHPKQDLFHGSFENLANQNT